MKIEDWECAGSLPLLYRELQELGLETNIAELDAFGFTIVPPEKIGPAGYQLELKQALEQVVADRFGDLTTDGNRWDDGAISFLPGSHRWRRQASPPEAKYWADRAHAVSAPAGSAVVWGNHTWHGSYPRKNTGIRMALQCEYMRPRFQPQEPYRETVTQQVLDRNPLRFAGLMDVYGPFPFGKNGPDIDHHGRFTLAGAEAPPGTGHGSQPTDMYCSLFDTAPANGRTTPRPRFDYFEHDGRMGTERRQQTMARLKAGGRARGRRLEEDGHGS